MVHFAVALSEAESSWIQKIQNTGQWEFSQAFKWVSLVER